MTTASGDMAFPFEEDPDDSLDYAVEAVYRLVKAQVGLDLRLYRQGTVTRRLWGRIQQLRLRDHGEYARLLASDVQESARLVSHVTIKVSSFLRNPELWSLLEEQVLPELLRSKPSIRAWSAGCGRGEEPFSLAILLREVAEREGRPLTATIHCSDIDEEALAVAQQGVYPREALGDAPEGLLRRYFTEQTGRFGPLYQVTDDIRSMVRFHRQDLLAADGGPEGGLYDLVLCRNVLIYLRATERAVTLRQQGDFENASSVVDSEMIPTMNRLVERTEEFVRWQFQQRDLAAEEMLRVQAEVARYSALLFFLVLVISVTLAVHTARSIQRPAGRLVSASRALIAGDFDSARLSAAAVAGPEGESTGNEIRELASVFRSMAESLQARERRLVAQAKLSSALASSMDPKQLGAEALHEMAGYAGLELGVVYAYDDEANLLRRVAGYSLDSVPDAVSPGEGIPGEAASSRRTIVVRDIHRMPLSAFDSASTRFRPGWWLRRRWSSRIGWSASWLGPACAR